MPEGSKAGSPDGTGQGEAGGRDGGGDDAGEGPSHGEGDGRGDREPLDLYQLCYELAGVIGVHPGEWTLRGLVWAATAKQKEAWGHTSTVVAQHYSIHRDPKKRREPYKPHEFNPFYEKPKPKMLDEKSFAEMFGD